MITFKIHQIKDIENTDYSFRGFKPDKFNFSDYEERYEMEFVSETDYTDLDICETIFHIFNLRRPEDFTGHSLSVSDVIELNKDGQIQFYYCDICGFVRISSI
jgi:hypothetical protein